MHKELQKQTIMARKPKAVGIYDKEIFIAKFDENGNIEGFDVLRHVTATMLADLRDAGTYKDYCEDLWRSAVMARSTELGLEDFAQELIDEADCDGDDEAFPLKDDYGLQYLEDEEREAADEFLLDTYDIEVGTWECSGSYEPCGFSDDKFEKFDFVFDKELAEAYYKTL